MRKDKIALVARVLGYTPEQVEELVAERGQDWLDSFDDEAQEAELVQRHNEALRQRHERYRLAPVRQRVRSRGCAAPRRPVAAPRERRDGHGRARASRAGPDDDPSEPPDLSPSQLAQLDGLLSGLWADVRRHADARVEALR